MNSFSRRRWGVIGPVTLAAVIISGVVIAPAAGLGTSTPGATVARAQGLAARPLLSRSAAITDTPTLTPTVVTTPTVPTTATVVPTLTSVVVTPTMTSVAATATSVVTSIVPPSATATAAKTATASATVVPVTATLTVTPTTISRGGLAYATGRGFQPGEKVDISLAGQFLTQAQADVAGVLPVTGFGVPYTTTTGAQTVTARGLTSRRVATATLTVVALSPTLTVSPTTVRPGTPVTVTACGYGGSERIVLALNGNALVTTPSAITTSVTGCFNASLRIPSSILAGLNTLSATGATSRVTSQVSLTGILPVAATWYFAGASTMAGETPRLSLLNPAGQSATVTVTFFSVAGTPSSMPLTVAPHARTTVDLRLLAGAGRRLGVQVQADRDVSASLTELRAGADQWSIPGVSAPATTWNLAEGYTGLSFKEYISILNPGTSSTVATLNLLPFNGRPARTIPYVIPPQRMVFVRVNDLMPRQSLSAIVTSTQPVVVERTMTFGTGDYGAHAKQGTTLSSVAWYFAEGSTLNNFETFLTVLNPNPAQVAFVTASYFSRTGASLGNQTIQIDPLHRGNFKLNDLVRSDAVATIVSANVPVVVERPLYFGPPNGGATAGTDVFGRNGTGTSFAFPEGNTSLMREFLLLFNSSGQTARVRATFYTNAGQVVTKDIVVPPFTRQNIDVNRDVPGLPLGDHGVVVRSTNNVGIVVEQSIFTNGFRTGSSSQGIVR